MPHQGILNMLNSFGPIGLSEMENVKLMNRTETKYVLPLNTLPFFLQDLPGNYRVLEIGEERIFSYHNLYLDTRDYYFFNQHLTGKLTRNKVRYRRYENTGVTYLEVKKKTNRNRVIKWRLECKLSPGNPCNEEALAFVNSHIRKSDITLTPVLINRFKRVTLVADGLDERVTIDFGLSYSGLSGNPVNFPFLSIIEIKRKEHGSDSVLGGLLKRNFVHPAGFSKYCIGNAVINNPLRQNALKSRFLLLKKLEDEYVRSFLS
jgi:hypothetical protein